jgi:hypothetical protein
MSVNEPRWKNTIWEIPLESNAPFAAEFAEFEQHKKTIIDTLRNESGAGSTSHSFDGENTWSALTRAAHWFFRRPRIKHKTVLPARRVERLRDLAKALRRAREMINKTMQDDVGLDLFRGWGAEANLPPTVAHVFNNDGCDEIPIADRINEIMTGVATLEAAANRAARDVPTKAGAPRGTGILTLADIAVLEGVYQRSTGRKPTKGAGPFAKFVEKFLVAVGHGDDTSEDYVVEAFKYARKQVRKKPGT